MKTLRTFPATYEGKRMAETIVKYDPERRAVHFEIEPQTEQSYWVVKEDGGQK